MNIVGLDIGGANVKASDGHARSLSRPFAVWRAPEELAGVLVSLLGEFPSDGTLAVTMTAELADCFETKAFGVNAVLDAVARAAGDRQASDRQAGDRQVGVWQTGGEFFTLDEAREFPRLVAAANWHALATWAGRLSPTGHALLIDIGSTTTDIIPLKDGLPNSQGLTDVERLMAGELVYSGVRRTPLVSIAHSVPLRGGYCPLAAELFATTLDLYLLSGDLLEEQDNVETANGKPATREAALDRLARMLCCDRTECTVEELTDVARFLADVQRQRIAGALERVCVRMDSAGADVLVAGEGEFLARRLVAGTRSLTGPVVSLTETLGPAHSQAACAFALARLGAEQLVG